MPAYEELGQAEQQAIELAKIGLQRLLRQQFRHRGARLYATLIASGLVDVLHAAERQPELVHAVNTSLAGTSWEVVKRASL